MDGDRFTHNPEVEGSNPSPATEAQGFAKVGVTVSD